MRDVIIIGAGGGGAVAAKELAAQGLDVLVLEGGPRHAHPEESWSRLENDANNPLSGSLRVGPEDRSKPWYYREMAQSSLVWQVTGVGGTTQHYFGNGPCAYPGVFSGYAGADRDGYDVEHPFPFSYGSFVPYYEWVETTLPVQTAPMGTKEEVYFRGCEGMGLPVRTTKTTIGPSYRPQENAILQPGGQAGLTTDPEKLTFPISTGCTFCGHYFQDCIDPVKAPRNLVAKRSTDNSYMPMALTSPPRPGRRAAGRSPRRGRASTARTEYPGNGMNMNVGLSSRPTRTDRCPRWSSTTGSAHLAACATGSSWPRRR